MSLRRSGTEVGEAPHHTVLSARALRAGHISEPGYCIIRSQAGQHASMHHVMFTVHWQKLA